MDKVRRRSRRWGRKGGAQWGGHQGIWRGGGGQMEKGGRERGREQEDGQGDLNFSMFPSPSGDRGGAGAFFIKGRESVVSSAKWIFADQYQSYSCSAQHRGSHCRTPPSVWITLVLQWLLDSVGTESMWEQVEVGGRNWIVPLSHSRFCTFHAPSSNSGLNSVAPHIITKWTPCYCQGLSLSGVCGTELVIAMQNSILTTMFIIIFFYCLPTRLWNPFWPPEHDSNLTTNCSYSRVPPKGKNT